ncbi:hypothetical protein [Lactiplantibacillus modestisalitolerans]|uniref:Uncharacterized protein n=1 Tax=Lactiplantibacillus modestisalitolerans TaxID=1457219 RepID=A0ABV5WSQ2_9LACO|nr:hypothetical protein [Lactiplantibacillus modestisalitolerans]
MSTLTEAQAALANADAILVSASNGLSISEGVNIFTNNHAFQQYLGPLADQYGFTSILQGAQLPLPPAARQAFTRQLHRYLIDDYPGAAQFQQIRQLISTKDYFVLTSNADQHFQQNDFDAQRIWEIEGNFFDLQMQSPAWQAQQRRFQDFTQRHAHHHLVQLELGIGAANRLIKLPLMQLINTHPQWQYVTLNLANEINVLPAIQDRTLTLPGDLTQTLAQLTKES